MKKYLARALRRAAQKLDPKPEPWVALLPVTTFGTSAVNVQPTYRWTQVGFDPEAAGRRAVRKHGRALRLLGNR